MAVKSLKGEIIDKKVNSTPVGGARTIDVRNVNNIQLSSIAYNANADGETRTINNTTGYWVTKVGE
jgi:hypothetical protein